MDRNELLCQIIIKKKCGGSGESRSTSLLPRRILIRANDWFFLSSIKRIIDDTFTSLKYLCTFETISDRFDTEFPRG